MTNPPHRGKGVCFAWLLDHVTHEGDECLIWPFARFHSGYGRLGHEGAPHRAHRLMCQLAHGDPPTPDHDAAHSCGHGHDACVHPDHLSWKTRSENLLERREHGTAKRKSFWWRKLTAAQAAEVRSLIGIETVAKTAARLGASEANIYHIRAGRMLGAVTNRQKLQEQPMAEHTPGPWAFDGPISNIHVYEAERPHMRVCFMTSDGRPRENARLIVAAPAMLAELRNCLCPRPSNTAPLGDITVEQCIDRSECGCSMGDAVKKATRP